MAYASVVALSSLSLQGCQTSDPLSMNSAQRAGSNGSLQFQIRWPTFKTQALAENTHRLLVGVYQGPFSGTPRYFILEAGQESVLFEQLAVGETRVFCVAFSADNTLLNGDTEVATVEAGQRKPILLDLQASPFAGLPPEEAEALQQWINLLFPPVATSSPVSRPASPVPPAGPTVAPSPTAAPTPVPVTPSASPAPTTTASPTASATPDTGSRGGFSGGGGGTSASPTPTPSPTTIDTGGQTGGTLQSEISIDDGQPRPDTVVIQ